MKWDQLQKDLGFETEKEMFEKLYTTESIASLSKRLGISPWSLRRKLAEHGITLKKRGGATKKPSLVMTDLILERIKNEGVAAIAKEFNVSKYTVFKKRNRFVAQQRSQQQSSPGSPGSSSSSNPQESR